MNDGPITNKDIEDNYNQADEDAYDLFQQEEDARMEFEWLARQEAKVGNPFADRALDDEPDDSDLDDLYDSWDYFPEEDEPLGLIMSRLDPYGVYSPDGRKIGQRRCGCEDYPCCGH